MKIFVIKHRSTGREEQVTEEQYHSIINHPQGKGMYYVIREIVNAPSQAEKKNAKEAVLKSSENITQETLSGEK